MIVKPRFFYHLSKFSGGFLVESRQQSAKVLFFTITRSGLIDWMGSVDLHFKDTGYSILFFKIYLKGCTFGCHKKSFLLTQTPLQEPIFVLSKNLSFLFYFEFKVSSMDFEADQFNHVDCNRFILKNEL